MAKVTYSEKLRDPRWQKKRLLIMERDQFICQKCSDDKTTLHVHHKFYLPGKDPWDYEDSALVTLCENCHVMQHEFEGFKTFFINQWLSAGLIVTDFEGLGVHESILTRNELKHLLLLLKSKPFIDELKPLLLKSYTPLDDNPF